MTRRAITTIAMLMFASATASAQGATFGVLGGLTSSKVSVSGQDVTVTFDSRTGFAGGLMARAPISDMFGLEVDALYAQKGSKLSGDGETGTLKLAYIDVPVLLSYRFGTGEVRPFLLAGGTISFKASCDVEATNGSVSASVSCQDLFNNSQKGTDLGATFGGGVDFSRYTVQARYTLGMTDIIDDGDSSVATKNRTLFVLAGILF